MSATLPISPGILPAILNTVLGRLTLLFLSGADGNIEVTRQAATQMLAAYNPQTENDVATAGKLTHPTG